MIIYMKTESPVKRQWGVCPGNRIWIWCLVQYSFLIKFIASLPERSMFIEYV